jgi:hypothetical protein
MSATAFNALYYLSNRPKKNPIPVAFSTGGCSNLLENDLIMSRFATKKNKQFTSENFRDERA